MGFSTKPLIIHRIGNVFCKQHEDFFGRRIYNVIEANLVSPTLVEWKQFTAMFRFFRKHIFLSLVWMSCHVTKIQCPWICVTSKYFQQLSFAFKKWTLNLKFQGVLESLSDTLLHEQHLFWSESHITELSDSQITKDHKSLKHTIYENQKISEIFSNSWKTPSSASCDGLTWLGWKPQIRIFFADVIPWGRANWGKPV